MNPRLSRLWQHTLYASQTMSKHFLILTCVSLAFGLALTIGLLAMVWSQQLASQNNIRSFIAEREQLVDENGERAKTIEEAEMDLVSVKKQLSNTETKLRRINQDNNLRNLTFETQFDQHAFIESFKNLSDDELVAMTADVSIDSSIYAAWQLFHRNITKADLGWNAGRFIGLVEGRLKLPIPRHWQYAIFNGQFSKGGFEVDLANYSDKFANISWESELRVCHPKGSSVFMTPKTIKVSMNGSRCEFPRSNLEGFPYGGGVAFSSLKDQCFYTPYDTLRPTVQMLTAVKIVDLRQVRLWDKYVWISGCVDGGFRLTPVEKSHQKIWSNHVELVVNEVFVGYFRVWERGVFLEVFRASDGVRVLSFDSNLVDFVE